MQQSIACERFLSWVQDWQKGGYTICEMIRCWINPREPLTEGRVVSLQAHVMRILTSTGTHLWIDEPECYKRTFSGWKNTSHLSRCSVKWCRKHVNIILLYLSTCPLLWGCTPLLSGASIRGTCIMLRKTYSKIEGYCPSADARENREAGSNDRGTDSQHFP